MCENYADLLQSKVFELEGTNKDSSSSLPTQLPNKKVNKLLNKKQSFPVELNMDEQSSRSFPQSQTEDPTTSHLNQQSEQMKQPQQQISETQHMQNAPAQTVPTSVVHATIDESSREQSQHISSGGHSRAYSQVVTRGTGQNVDGQAVQGGVGSVQHEHEYGSAEAMEYTPSNTSANQSNSIPTHLITVSNSNLFLSGTKQIQAGSVTSPSPMLHSQINNANQPMPDPNSETKVPLPSELGTLPARRYSDNSHTKHQQTSKFGSQNTPQMAPNHERHGQSFGANQNGLSNQNQQAQIIAEQPSQEMKADDQFFDQHAHLLIQQQRNSQNGQNRQSCENRNQNFKRINNFGAQNQVIQGQNLQQKQQPLNAPRHQNEPVIYSNQEANLDSNGSYEGESQVQPSSIPTPGFQGLNGPSGLLSEEPLNKGPESQGVFGGNSNVHNFSIGSGVGQDQIQSGTTPISQQSNQVSQPRVILGSNAVTSSIVSSQRSQPQVRHQVISLVQQKQHLQPQTYANEQQVNFTMQKLQQKVREQAERLQHEANYRHLCEERISQLDPEHPFPINAGHLTMNAFTAPQNPEYKKQNQQESQDTSNEAHLKKVIEKFQLKIQELSAQVSDRDQIEAKLRQTELSLRSETLQSEEQRAYIEMLKNQVEEKLNQAGFVFEMEQANVHKSRDRSSSHHSNVPSNSYLAAQANNRSNTSFVSLQRSGNGQITRPLDGFLQLNASQKKCEELQIEISQLKSKLQKSAENLGKALEEQRDEFLIQMEQLQEQLRREEQSKKELNEEKETLLDYAKDSMQKQKQAENLITQNEAQQNSTKEAIISKNSQIESLKKEFTAKNELLDQVKQNLEKVRAEAAKFKSEHELISAENSKLKLAKQEADSDRERVQNELRQEMTKLEGLTEKLKTENREIQERYKVTQRETQRSKFILKELEEHQHETRKRLSLETSKHVDALLQANNLKTTLVDSQQEMAELVSKYEQAVEDLLQRDTQINQQNVIIYEKHEEIAKINEEISSKDENLKSLNRELSDLYATLQRKNDLLKQVENRLQTKLNDKEEECFQLHQQLGKMEHTFAQETQELDSLKRICDDKISEGEKHARLLRDRDESLKDLKSELISVKLTNEINLKSQCDPLQEENGALKAEVGEKRIIIEELQKELDELTQQLASGQQKIDEIEIESNQNAKKLKEAQEKANRFEEEVFRLENLHKRGEIAQESSQEHVERIRSQQIDNAMLIEQMREKQGEVKDLVNSIVGRISNFGANLEQMGQVGLSRHIEQAYTEAKTISPATLEVKAVLQSITKFVKHLTSEIIQSYQLAPVKDSLNENTLSNQKINVDRASSAMSMERLISQKSAQNAYNDEQFEQNINQRNEIQEFDSEMKKKRLANSTKQLPALTDDQNGQILNKDAYFTLSEPEKNSLKNQILQLEEQQTLNQAWNNDLESALRLCCQISSLENSIKLSLQELAQKIQTANLARRDRARLSEKVTQMETRYHTRSRQTMTSATKDELVVLKSEIRDERYELHQLEIKIESLDRDKQKGMESIKRTNAILVDNSAETALKVKNLTDLVDQLKLERNALHEQLEWKTHQFNEAKDLRNRFHPVQIATNDESQVKSRSLTPDIDRKSPKQVAPSTSIMPLRTSNESGSNGVTSHARLQTYVGGPSENNLGRGESQRYIAGSHRQFTDMRREQTELRLASPHNRNTSLKPLGTNRNETTPIYTSPTLTRCQMGNINQTTAINAQVPEVSSMGDSHLSYNRRGGYSQAERERDASLRRSLENLSQASQLIRRKYSQVRVENNEATQPATSLRARDPSNESARRQNQSSPNTAYQSYRREMMKTAMPLRASPTRNVSLSPITDERLTTGDLATAQFAFSRQ